MTQQIKDSVQFEDQEFGVVGFRGSGMFLPSDSDIDVAIVTSGCWRGFYCRYTVNESQLLLTDAHFGLSYLDQLRIKAGKGPNVFGHTLALPADEDDCWNEGHLASTWMGKNACVRGIAEPVSFTGGILLGRDLSWDRHEDTRFHPAFQYRLVFELAFDDGLLIERTNHADPRQSSPPPDFSAYSYHSY